MPEKYLAALLKKNPKVAESRELNNRATVNLEVRLKVMDRYPDVLQVLTTSLPPLDEVLTPTEAEELARIANDELAELVVKYPNKFFAAVACLPFNNMDAALEETDRAITKLGLKGVQLNARVNGEHLDNPKFKPLYEKMAKYNLPMWIHPCSDYILDESVFGWPFATANEMRLLVKMGIFNSYPNIKFITHHCGGVVPYCEGRIQWLLPFFFGMGHPVQSPIDHFRKFYADTAMYGSTLDLMLGYSFFGADHILFGTDAPFGPKYGVTLETIKSVERMSIPDIDKEKIFMQNAVNLLRLAI
jgi:aminocarboxymuconate-semialdehyde decarboxylase